VVVVEAHKDQANQRQTEAHLFTVEAQAEMDIFGEGLSQTEPQYIMAVEVLEVAELIHQVSHTISTHLEVAAKEVLTMVDQEWPLKTAAQILAAAAVAPM
jgi:hypothetical protein